MKKSRNLLIICSILTRQRKQHTTKRFQRKRIFISHNTVKVIRNLSTRNYNNGEILMKTKQSTSTLKRNCLKKNRRVKASPHQKMKSTSQHHRNLLRKYMLILGKLKFQSILLVNANVFFNSYIIVSNVIPTLLISIFILLIIPSDIATKKSVLLPQNKSLDMSRMVSRTKSNVGV